MSNKELSDTYDLAYDHAYCGDDDKAGMEARHQSALKAVIAAAKAEAFTHQADVLASRHAESLAKRARIPFGFRWLGTTYSSYVGEAWFRREAQRVTEAGE